MPTDPVPAPHGASSSPAPNEREPWLAFDLSRDEMTGLAREVVDMTVEHLASLWDQPASDLEGALELAETFREPLPEGGAPLDRLLPRIDAAARKSFTAPGPGYLAYIPGGGLFASALGEFMGVALNRYVGVWNAAPALVEIEARSIEWIADYVHYPSRAGLLTSGGSMSNLIAVFTARREKLGDDLDGGRIYSSRDTHHCVDKAARICGFSDRHLRAIDVDEKRRLRVDELERAIREDRAAGLRPFLVVANAGTTNTGAVDPLPAIAELCERMDLWLHCDGAYGGVFRALDDGRERVPALERADSVTLDPHKGLFLPYGTGCLLMRDGEALQRAHASGADYLQDLDRPDGAVDYSQISPELSRENRGLRVWLPFKLHGAAAFRAALQEKVDLARRAYAALCATPGFECLEEPPLTVVVFRYVPERGDANAFNRTLLERVVERKRVFLSSTQLDGVYVLRLCFLSFRTQAEHLEFAIEDLRESAATLVAALE